MTLRRVAPVALLAALCACGGNDASESAPAPGRGIPGAQPPPAAPSAPQAGYAPAGSHPWEHRAADPSPSVAPGSWRARPSAEDLAPPPPRTVTETVATTVAPTGRDLPGELRTLLGEPVSCVSPDDLASLPEHVHLSASATATPAGIVTAAHVGGNLQADALACLERRLLAAHFAGGIADAPRAIAATADYDRAPRPAPAPAPAPP